MKTYYIFFVSGNRNPYM